MTVTNLDQRLRQRVNLDKTRIHSSSEAAEASDQTNVTLSHWLVWVRAEHAAGDGAQSTDAGSESIDHRTCWLSALHLAQAHVSAALLTVPAMLRRILSVGLDDLRVRRLEILAARRLDLDDGVGVGDRRLAVCVAATVHLDVGGVDCFVDCIVTNTCASSVGDDIPQAQAGDRRAVLKRRFGW